MGSPRAEDAPYLSTVTSESELEEGLLRHGGPEALNRFREHGYESIDYHLALLILRDLSKLKNN